MWFEYVSLDLNEQNLAVNRAKEEIENKQVKGKYRAPHNNCQQTVNKIVYGDTTWLSGQAGVIALNSVLYSLKAYAVLAGIQYCGERIYCVCGSIKPRRKKSHRKRSTAVGESNTSSTETEQIPTNNTQMQQIQPNKKANRTNRQRSARSKQWQKKTAKKSPD